MDHQRGALAALKAPMLMIGSGLSLYCGAALASQLFTFLPPYLVAWLRVIVAAIIYLVIFRPSPAARSRENLKYAFIFGIATLAMNCAFYEAVARLPLGTAVAMEFLGPVTVAALASRQLTHWLALILAATGVWLLAGPQWDVARTGVLFGFLAAFFWAMYIVFGAKVATANVPSQQLMGMGFFFAALLSAPIMILKWPQTALPMPHVNFILFIIGVGILSTALPYTLEQKVLALVGPAHYSILAALLPITGTVVGWIFLAQYLAPKELSGIALVVLAIVLREIKPRRKADPGAQGA